MLTHSSEGLLVYCVMLYLSSICHPFFSKRYSYSSDRTETRVSPTGVQSVFFAIFIALCVFSTWRFIPLNNALGIMVLLTLVDSRVTFDISYLLIIHIDAICFLPGCLTRCLVLLITTRHIIRDDLNNRSLCNWLFHLPKWHCTCFLNGLESLTYIYY